MGQPSRGASIAIIVVTYAAFLVFGCVFAFLYRKQTKQEFIATPRTKKALPLALNFIAAGMGAGILFTYPEIATIAGVQGLLVYAITSALPLLSFMFFAPLIRKKLPDGFILTEWVRHRFGTFAALYLSFLTCATMGIFMVAELSSVRMVMNALTGLDGLPIIITQVIITALYTSLGGFRVSFATDNIQGALVVLLVIICSIAVGTQVKVDKSLIDSSGLTKPSLLGWQLIYILFVALMTNAMFLSSFWMRAFSSKTDKDLRIGVSIAAVTICIILTIVGTTGLLAVWSGIENPGAIAFFLLIGELPSWVVGFVVVMVLALSTAAYDTLMSAFVTTASTDLFRNKLPLVYIRILVLLVNIPIIILALKAESILQIYLISDIFSATTIPPLLLGLSSTFFFLNQWDIIISSLGGLLAVFFFGLVYYDGNSDLAGKLLILSGLYAEDWSAFGTFVAAPVGALVVLAMSVGGRYLYQLVMSKISGAPLTIFENPAESDDSVERESVRSNEGDNKRVD